MKPPSEEELMRYYEVNAEEYIRSTKDLDMTALYDQFLPHVPAGGLILDAGCGSGRDAKLFAELGYRVEAIDVSHKMVEAASQHPGVTASVQRIEDVRAIYKYDGIWACASLVHMHHVEIGYVLQNLIKGLKPHGALFVSFKRGVGRVFESGRAYTLFEEATLRELLGEVAGAKLESLRLSDDLRGAEFRGWVNAAVRRV
jgi:2-polyprenyl-3-methyl-5-hydroxy-6-metoxy-1,4-benzoquinol methylase